jgi:hypothetical protein
MYLPANPISEHSLNTSPIWIPVISEVVKRSARFNTLGHCLIYIFQRLNLFSFLFPGSMPP